MPIPGWPITATPPLPSRDHCFNKSLAISYSGRNNKTSSGNLKSFKRIATIFSLGRYLKGCEPIRTSRSNDVSSIPQSDLCRKAASSLLFGEDFSGWRPCNVWLRTLFPAIEAKSSMLVRLNTWPDCGKRTYLVENTRYNDNVHPIAAS